MSEPETPKPIAKIERHFRTNRPLQSLFLVDVVRDPDSRPVLLWAVTVLATGTLAYHWLEGWSLLDALYFCVITLATVGYGDLSPTTPIAKVFTIVYVINGIAILLAFFDRIRIVRARRIESGDRRDRSGSQEP